MYLVSASLNFKDYIECTLKIFLKWLSKISDPFTSTPKVSKWWHFIYSWRDLTPLLHIHLEITIIYIVNLDAIKASVPKFLNFLGAELNNNWITQFEGITLLLAGNNDRNQISKRFIHLPKIRFKIISWIMQKVYFCPEGNIKPSHCKCATFYTKNFYQFFNCSKSL